MVQPIENYVPQTIAATFRRQAVKVWSVSLLLVFAWVFAILLAPLAKANGFANVAAPIYGFFSYICHQISNRSFHVEGEQFAVCSRCFGVYFGLLAGFLIYPLWRKIDDIEPVPRFWLFLSMIPIGVDWSLGVFGIWENTHLSRFITGLILGIACATFLVPGLVEITRNLSLRFRRQKIAASGG
ncbi:MAG TPA: DUF2085 domain-containing protein [Pyrinomonadaceae bacterium]|jgi:uncharacterized membrane protein|nr:DUF2085 domain-containing protein [Pyrinomonadaceae bacterium]